MQHQQTAVIAVQTTVIAVVKSPNRQNIYNQNSLLSLCKNTVVAVVKKQIMKEEKFNTWYISVIGALVVEIILFYLFTQYFN